MVNPLVHQQQYSDIDWIRCYESGLITTDLTNYKTDYKKLTD